MQACRPDTELNDSTALRAAVATELAREGVSFRFPPILRQRYEADRAISRARELRRLAGQVAIIYPLITLFMHFIVAPRQPMAAMVVQLLVLPPALLLARRLWARPGLSAFWREAMVLALCCMVVIGGLLHVALARADLVILDMFFIVTPVIGCMFFTRMSPITGLAFVAFSVVGLAVLAWARHDVLGASGVFPVGALATASAFALIALRELDAALRRLYLSGLEQRLRIVDLAAENVSLDLMAGTDPLTGAGNRRHFEKALAALRADAGHFLLLVDIDYFKQLNDRHGHNVGDACLREAVAVMRACLRPADSLARIGGDEFAVLANDCSRADARRTADEICARVAGHAFEIDGVMHQITVTIGAAEGSGGGDVAELLAAADAALYQAKWAGRGRVAWKAPAERGHASAPKAGTIAA
jgi:diguanylate cyclase (GGDEF)-like protein